MKNLFVLLLLLSISSIGMAQDPALAGFDVEVNTEYVDFRWDTYGVFPRSDFGILKFTEDLGWVDLSLHWEDSTSMSNKFQFTDTLLRNGVTLFYELYRKTKDGPVCGKKVVIRDGEVTLVIYPMKTIHNLIIKSDVPVHGRVKLFDGDGNVPVDNVMLLHGRTTIHGLLPGNYLMELDNFQIQEVFPIRIE